MPRLRSFAVLLAGCTVIPPLPIALASDQPMLEEVVVTARKREESLQEVPVAVSAFSQEAMQSLGIKNLRDFDGLVPGLHLGGGGNGLKGDGNAYIRGVGQRETRVTIDSGVGIYLDDVYIARSSGALLDAVDIESVQVLRGPQGTLFGKNTTGGAILYRSIKPSTEFNGDAELTLGNFERRDYSLSLDVPLIGDSLLSRWTFAGLETEGYTENQIDGTDWTNDDRQMGVAQLRWVPSDSVIVDFIANFTRTRQQPQGHKCTNLDDDLAEAGFPEQGSLEAIYDVFSPISVQEYCRRSGTDLPIDEFQSEQNTQDEIFYQASYDVNTAMVAATTDWEITDSLQLKSITGYRNTEQVADEDVDAMEAALIGRYAPRNNDTDQYSQEFQFIGNSFDEKLNYTLGLYGFLEETNDAWIQDYAGYVENTTVPNNILLTRSNLTERETKNTAWAAFTQADWNFSDNVVLTLGLRYTWEKRETKYREARVYLPSIGNGEYLGEFDTIYTANVLHPFSEPGGRPLKEWEYGFDPDGPGGRDFVVGDFGELKDSRNDDDWNPMGSLKYIATDSVLDALRLDDAMIYFTYASGFRSGGVTVANGDFDGDQIIDLENFKPETVDMYEIGFKIDALERSLRTNVAIYYQDYNDIQLTTTIPDPNFGIPLPAIENAGKAEIKGVELEFTFLPTQQWRFIGSVSYMDAQYKEFLSEIPVDGEQTVIDRSDEPMPRAPEWTAFLSTDYFIDTDRWGTFVPNFVVRYQDEIYGGFDRDSFFVQDAINSPAKTFYDARLTWQAPGQSWKVTAWCKNLTDIDDHIRGGVPTVGVARTAGLIYSRPRTYGVDIRYHFGD
ncbi:MAG: TonB-dependent receptor [Pseudomonadota bacterium]